MSQSMDAATELQRIIIRAREQYEAHYDRTTRQVLREIFGADTFNEKSK